jgi:hypothetical protein
MVMRGHRSAENNYVQRAYCFLIKPTFVMIARVRTCRWAVFMPVLTFRVSS